MFNLAIILLSLINSEVHETNNYKIAKYILENINDLESCSITELAKKCYVSNSSISRFCRDIGLKDYNDLKNQIAKYQVSHEIAIQKFNYSGMNEAAPMLRYVDAVIAHLELLKNNLDEQSIIELVHDIDRYESVAAFGYLQSETVALNLQFDLQTSRKVIFTCMPFANQVEYIKEANEKNLIIIFSSSGTYFQRAFARTALFKNKEHKPKIYMITSNPTITIPYIDHYIRYQGDSNYASHPYPLLVIADMICFQYSKLHTSKNKFF